MKLTYFFILLGLFFISILIFLKPEMIQKSGDKQTAQLEIEDFTLYKLSKLGVDSVVSGTIGRQYKTYYEVENTHYIENKNKISEHLYADKGIFKKDIAYLDDNVRYFREDGLSFESEHAIYNTKREKLYVPDKFVLSQNENIVYGKELHYNSKTGRISAKAVDANYYIEDKK